MEFGGRKLANVFNVERALATYQYSSGLTTNNHKSDRPDLLLLCMKASLCKGTN